MERDEVYEFIDRERAFQDRKWESRHEVSGWLLILQRELDEAKEAWITRHGDVSALEEIVQVAAVAIACLEEHGAWVNPSRYKEEE